MECAKCEKRTKAVRRLAVLDSPHYLLVTLKRFRKNGQKDTGLVKYPGRLTLDPKVLLPEDQRAQFKGQIKAKEKHSEPKYTLQAVVVHEGENSTSGHYYCVARRGSKVHLP